VRRSRTRRAHRRAGKGGQGERRTGNGSSSRNVDSPSSLHYSVLTPADPVWFDDAMVTIARPIITRGTFPLSKFDGVAGLH
jgi:hypothetical protein